MPVAVDSKIKNASATASQDVIVKRRLKIGTEYRIMG